MTAGLIAEWDFLEFYLSAAFTTTAPGTGGKAGGGEAQLTTTYAFDSHTVSPGITMNITSVKAGPTSVYGSSKTIYSLAIPDLSISNTDTVASFSASANCKLLFTDYKCYAVNGGVFYQSWSDLAWYRNGTLDTSYGAGSITSSAAYLTPTAIPILGFPAKLEASGITSPVPVVGPTGTGMTPDSLSGDCTITASGWRYKIGSTWLTPTVNCSVLATPALTCAASPSIGTVSASTTYDGAAYGSQSWVVASASRTWDILSAEVTLLPNIPRAVNRMNDDYAALIFRWGLPKAERHAVKSCEVFDLEGDSVLTSATTDDTVFDSYTYLLSTVENATHVIEDPFAETIYAPYRVRGEKYYMNPAGVTRGERNSSLDELIEDSATNTQMCPGYDHTEPIYRYVNYCASPHWSYFYYFPADSDTDFWKLDGAKVNSEDYWVPIRTQYLEHSALPSGERLKTRNSMVSAPLLEGCYSQYIKDYFFANSQTSWWGNTRWKAKQWNGSASIALDADTADDWTATDCVLTFGATKITVNVDSGKTTGILEYDLGQLVRDPFFYGHFANFASLNWVTTNVSAVRMYLQSAAGEKELMGSTVATHQKAFITGTKYAGSWAQDFGYLQTTDTGVDTEANGVSAAAMIDPELWLTIGQVGARNGAVLRIEVDVISDATDAEIYYPVLYRPTTNPAVYHEHGHCSALLWDSGPGLRYGQWAWLETDPVTNLLTDPAIFPIGFAPIGWKSSALDAFCWKNTVLEGVDRSTNLATQLRAEYNNYELIGTESDPSNNNQVYRESDSFTLSFVTSGGDAEASLPGGTYHLVNTCQEIPPLPHFPYADRDNDTFQIDLTLYAQESYALDQQPRYIASALPSTDLVEPSPSTGVWTALASGAPTDWQLVKHSHQVDNDETDQFRLRADGMFFATLSPYHGYTTLLWPATENAGGVDYDVSRSWRHARGYVMTGTAWLGFKSNEGTGWTAVDTTVTAGGVSICYPAAGQDDQLRVLIEDGGTLDLYTATEAGVLTMAFSLGAGTYGDIVFTPNNIFYGLRLDSGTVYVSAYDAEGNALGAEVTSNLTGLDDAPIAAESSVGANGESRLHCLYAIGGSLTVKTSLDGGSIFS